MLKDAPSDAALDDVEARARLLLPEEDPSLAGARHKRPQRSSLYAYCKSQGLAEVAAKFGSVRQLGANLQKGFVVSFILLSNQRVLGNLSTLW